MAGRYSARRIDGDEGWVRRRFRELENAVSGVSTGALQTVEGSAVSITQVLTDPASLVGFLNTDQVAALADDAAVTLNLTYVPIDGSTHVRQNGVDLERSEWTRVGNVVTIDPSATVVIRANDVFDAAYAYDGTAVAAESTDSEYDAAVLSEPTLLGYWRLAETSGLVMEDSSGNNRHGTYNSYVALGSSPLLPGDPDTSAHFPDLATGVVPYGSWMDAPAFTIECWAATDNVSSGVLALPNRDTNARSWIFRQDSGGGLRFEKIQGGVVSSTTSASLDDTGSHMVAATYDGSNIRLYIDGTLVQTTACTGDMSTAGYLAVGGTWAGFSDFWPAYYYKGRLSKVAYYSGAQDVSAILTRYQIGAGL